MGVAGSWQLSQTGFDSHTLNILCSDPGIGPPTTVLDLYLRTRARRLSSATFRRDGCSRPLPEDSSHTAPRRPRHRFLTSTRGLELNGFATSGLGERGYPWRALGERQHDLPTRYVLVPLGYTLGRYCTRKRSIRFLRVCVVVVLRANGGTTPENLCSRWRGGNAT